MAKLGLVARVFLGLIFAIFGLNGVIQILTGTGFLPMPEPAQSMKDFIGVLYSAGYLMPIVKIVELVAGVLFLIGKAVPLAIVMITPIMINIVGIHAVFDPAGLPMGLVLTIGLLILIKQNLEAFKKLL